MYVPIGSRFRFSELITRYYDKEGKLSRETKGSASYIYEAGSKGTRSNGQNKNGWKYPTGYSRHSYKASPPSGTEVTLARDGSWVEVTGRPVQTTHIRSIPGVGLPSTPPATDLVKYQQLVTDTRLKIQDGRFNAAVALAEGKESVNMVASNTVLILKAIAALKRKQYKQAALILAGAQKLSRKNRRRLRNHRFREKYSANGLDILSNRWLELQYGWLPLLSDIKAAVDLFTKLQNPNRRPLYSVQRNLSWNESIEGEIPNGTYSGNIRRNMRMKIFYTITDYNRVIQSQLGFTNPFLILWERRPFSFVIDWLVPIGPWLDSLTATQGTSFFSGYYTVYEETTLRVQYDRRTSLQASSCSQDVVKRAYVRYPLKRFPVSVPYFKNPFSTGHVKNALALLWQSRK